MVKYLVVGCGLSGAVIAERIANKLNQKSNHYRKKRTHRWELL